MSMRPGGGAVLESERGHECRPLTRRQRVDLRQQGMKKFMQPGVSDFHLALQTGTTQPRVTVGDRPVRGSRQQRGLADTRSAVDHQRGATSGDIGQHIRDSGKLFGSPHHHLTEGSTAELVRPTQLDCSGAPKYLV
ncbi:hypothetical protein NLB33_26195 [Mycolicibacterium smegmatis]|nr:hypothetical protein [Mycolicibacterium smegmatis]MCP2625570.1 hypothetical protein [Mycolicibacterium smegmatis]MCP2626339.1 hypothetical protein [Mycolicibacterium smegmatis]